MKTVGKLLAATVGRAGVWMVKGAIKILETARDMEATWRELRARSRAP